MYNPYLPNLLQVIDETLMNSREFTDINYIIHISLITIIISLSNTVLTKFINSKISLIISVVLKLYLLLYYFPEHFVHHYQVFFLLLVFFLLSLEFYYKRITKKILKTTILLIVIYTVMLISVRNLYNGTEILSDVLGLEYHIKYVK